MMAEEFPPFSAEVSGRLKAVGLVLTNTEDVTEFIIGWIKVLKIEEDWYLSQNMPQLVAAKRSEIKMLTLLKEQRIKRDLLVKRKTN
jgi:hypothetical protein